MMWTKSAHVEYVQYWKAHLRKQSINLLRQLQWIPQCRQVPNAERLLKACTVCICRCSAMPHTHTRFRKQSRQECRQTRKSTTLGQRVKGRG